MRFSVIIPLYNKAAYISKAISSVLEQDFLDYELIIVDDGSSDDSGLIAERTISGTEARIIHQKNAGVGAARNTGVANSHGDYVCFLDADDWWDNSFLSEMDSLISRYPDAGVYGLGYYYVKNGKASQRVKSEDGYINYFKVYADNMQMPLTSISVAIPRSIFDSYNGFSTKLKLGEDFDLWARIATNHKVAYCNTAHAYYNQDVEVSDRATKKIQEPDVHILWNLQDLEIYSKDNKDLKLLLDKLRLYAFLPYMSRLEYRNRTIPELKKIDWRNQSYSTRILYSLPISILKVREVILTLGSSLKQKLKKSTCDS